MELVTSEVQLHCRRSRQTRQTPQTAGACCVQLTISNVGDPGTMHNGGLENTLVIVDMVLDNSAGHK
jgi:hypothetical protein